MDNPGSPPSFRVTQRMRPSPFDDDCRRPLRDALAAYARCWPAEADCVAGFEALLDDPGDPYVRERLAGHLTASSWLVDRSGTRALLTHHRKLGRWLQPGGHADGDRDLMRVALREAEEETGLTGLRVEAGIFDLDRHRIPAHRDVPEHWHYDVRYVVHAGEDEAFMVGGESHALAWRAVIDVAGDGEADPSLRRMASKWLARDAVAASLL